MLDAVDRAEARQLEAHLAGCATCRWELTQLRQAADVLPPPRPSEELWKRIVADVRATEQEQGEHEQHGEADGQTKAG